MSNLRGVPRTKGCRTNVRTRDEAKSNEIRDKTKAEVKARQPTGARTQVACPGLFRRGNAVFVFLSIYG